MRNIVSYIWRRHCVVKQPCGQATRNQVVTLDISLPCETVSTFNIYRLSVASSSTASRSDSSKFYETFSCISSPRIQTFQLQKLNNFFSCEIKCETRKLDKLKNSKQILFWSTLTLLKHCVFEKNGTQSLRQKLFHRRRNYRKLKTSNRKFVNQNLHFSHERTHQTH